MSEASSLWGSCGVHGRTTESYERCDQFAQRTSPVEPEPAGRCRSCRHWLKDRRRTIFGECLSSKIGFDGQGGDYAHLAGSDGMAFVFLAKGEQSGRFLAGENFGCVQWDRRPESR